MGERRGRSSNACKGLSSNRITVFLTLNQILNLGFVATLKDCGGQSSGRRGDDVTRNCG
jgi:hypothetical protein